MAVFGQNNIFVYLSSGLLVFIESHVVLVVISHLHIQKELIVLCRLVLLSSLGVLCVLKYDLLFSDYKNHRTIAPFLSRKKKAENRHQFGGHRSITGCLCSNQKAERSNGCSEVATLCVSVVSFCGRPVEDELALEEARTSLIKADR